MSPLKPWVVAGIVAIIPLLGSAPARADATQSCLDYAGQSDMIKAVPAQNRQKWCGCLVDKFDADEEDALSDVFDAVAAEEARGHAFNAGQLPGPLVPVGRKYTEVLNQCLMVLFGQ
jgi:hypothetical protein